MALDWIKVRIDLPEDPDVITIASRTDLDEYSVVGRLIRLWGWADRHCKGGHAPGVTADWIDRYVQCDGFAEAMVEVGWLSLDELGANFLNFDRHNGKSAKTRAQGAVRQQEHRAGAKKAAS